MVSPIIKIESDKKTKQVQEGELLKPYYKNWIDVLLDVFSFKFLTNMTFFITIFSYFTNLDRLFILFSPFIFVNLITVTILQLFDWDKVILGITGDDDFKRRSDEERKKIINNDSTLYIATHLFSLLYHLLAAIFVYYLLDEFELNSVNFMENYLIQLFILLIFWLLSKKPYGNINEPIYGLIYIIVLFIVNYYLLYRKDI
jgi:hypothetical protein